MQPNQQQSRIQFKKKKPVEAKTNIPSPTHSTNNSIVVPPLSTPALNQALNRAILKDSFRMVDRAIKAGAEVDELAGDTANILHKHTPLYLAAFRGNRQIVERLLSASKASVNTPDAEGYTPLHAACQEGHTDIVPLLIAAGASTEATDQDGETPLFVTTDRGHQQIIDILLSTPNAGDKPNARKESPLFRACENGDIAIVTKLLNAGTNIDLANKNGNTPLHIAAIKGHADIVNLLLTRGADSSLRNSAGKTAYECLATDFSSSLNCEQKELVIATLRGYKALFHYRVTKFILMCQLVCFDNEEMVVLKNLQRLFPVYFKDLEDETVVMLKNKLMNINDPHYEILTTRLANVREQLLLAIEDYSISKDSQTYKDSLSLNRESPYENKLQLPFFSSKEMTEKIQAPPAPPKLDSTTTHTIEPY